MRLTIESKTDAIVAVQNSGAGDWSMDQSNAFGDIEEFSDGLAEYIYRNCEAVTLSAHDDDEADAPHINEVIAAYLVSVGESPSEYGV